MEEAKAHISSSEFVRWVEFLDREVTGFHREDYYLAQVAAEIRRGNVTTPKSVKIEDFILDFHTEGKAPAEPQDRLNQSKSYWLGMTGTLGGKAGRKKTKKKQRKKKPKARKKVRKKKG